MAGHDKTFYICQMLKNIAGFFSFLILATIVSLLQMSCGQIGMPTGGPKDSLPPRLVKASPNLKMLNFNSKEIKLTFDEYVEVADIQKNVFISPLTKYNPQVSYSLHTVTIKLKDTLKPNTTYTINFGDAIKDINEGNIFKDFAYTFSTGNYIDSLSLEGRVVLAETGKADSTLLVLLYRNADDTAVVAKKPDYIAKVSGSGKFKFTNLPSDNFRVYALKDNDAGKTYNIKTEMFAFMEGNKPFKTPYSGDSLILFAFQQEKQKETPSGTTGNTKSIKATETKLKYTISTRDRIDLLNPIEIDFNIPIKNFRKEKIVFSDTNYKVIGVKDIHFDTLKNRVIINNNWQPEMQYKLMIDKDAFGDSAKYLLAKADTVSLKAKSVEDYGKVTLRFTNIDLKKKPVIQFFSSDELKIAFPITASEWKNELFPPGEYTVRILYDDNGNGIWDSGNFRKNQQPEKVVPLPQSLNIRANWENEREITL